MKFWKHIPDIKLEDFPWQLDKGKVKSCLDLTPCLYSLRQPKKLDPPRNPSNHALRLYHEWNERAHPPWGFWKRHTWIQPFKKLAISWLHQFCLWNHCPSEIYYWNLLILLMLIIWWKNFMFLSPSVSHISRFLPPSNHHTKKDYTDYLLILPSLSSSIKFQPSNSLYYNFTILYDFQNIWICFYPSEEFGDH